MVLSLIQKLFAKSDKDSVPQRIYGAVMAQSRKPEFFSNFGVEDSVIGRTDMLTLHVYLFNRRLKSVTGDNREIAQSLSQDVFDLFVKDLERGLRDIGFADGGVHKRKKKLIRSYYAMIDEFDGPILEQEMEQLNLLIKSRFYGNNPEEPDPNQISGLGNYIRSACDSFDKQSFSDFLKARLIWPLPSEMLD